MVRQLGDGRRADGTERTRAVPARGPFAIDYDGDACRIAIASALDPARGGRGAAGAVDAIVAGIVDGSITSTWTPWPDAAAVDAVRRRPQATSAAARAAGARRRSDADVLAGPADLADSAGPRAAVGRHDDRRCSPRTPSRCPTVTRRPARADRRPTTRATRRRTARGRAATRSAPASRRRATAARCARRRRRRRRSRRGCRASRARPGGAGRGRRRAARAATAATSAQPGPTSSAAATTQTRRGDPAPPPRHRPARRREPGRRRAPGRARRRSSGDEHEARQHGEHGEDEGDGERALRGPARSPPSTGPSDGGIHQPLNPPSTSCGSPRSPSAVDADHESWKPSPSTSQHPSGQPSTVTSRLEAVLRRDGGRGCRRRPRRPGGRVRRARRGRCRARSRRAGRRRQHVRRRRASSSGASVARRRRPAVRRPGRGDVSPDDPHRERRRRRWSAGRRGSRCRTSPAPTVRGPIEISLIAAGSTTGSP